MNPSQIFLNNFGYVADICALKISEDSQLKIHYYDVWMVGLGSAQTQRFMQEIPKGNNSKSGNLPFIRATFLG